MGGWARRLAFEPRRLPKSLVPAIALLPPVAAGLAIFGLPAIYMLAVAIGAGAATQLLARLAGRRLETSPIVTAAVGVALAGPGAPLWWSAVIAAAACLLETVRSLLPGRPLPFHSGLWAYAAVFLAGRGAPGAYLAPGRGSRAFPEPIRLWHDFFGGAAAPLDPVTLYVGNVAGPVFATSLLAVSLGAAWLWYAKRLDLVAIVGVAAGAVAAAAVEGWSPAYQVLSGPFWFAAAYAYADERLLAGPPLLGGLIGAGAAFGGVGLRSRGIGIEGAVVAFAAAQLGVVVLIGLGRGVRAAVPSLYHRLRARVPRPPRLPGRTASSAGGQLK